MLCDLCCRQPAPRRHRHRRRCLGKGWRSCRRCLLLLPPSPPRAAALWNPSKSLLRRAAIDSGSSQLAPGCGPSGRKAAPQQLRQPTALAKLVVAVCWIRVIVLQLAASGYRGESAASSLRKWNQTRHLPLPLQQQYCWRALVVYPCRAGHRTVLKLLRSPCARHFVCRLQRSRSELLAFACGTRTALLRSAAPTRSPLP